LCSNSVFANDFLSAERAKVFAMAQQLASTRRGALKTIAEKFKTNHRYPKRLAEKISNGGTIQRVKGSGRPSKMTPEKVNLLNDYLHQKSFDCTYKQLSQHVGVGTETIRTFMANNGYRKTGKYLRPYLSQNHKDARLAWAAQHLDDDFSTTVDIDEKVLLQLKYDVI